MSSTGPAGGHGPGTAAGQQTQATGGASQLHGHYKYAKGAVEQKIGKVTGAIDLQSAGKADQTAGLTKMRAARQHIDPSNAAHPARQTTAHPVTSTSNSDTTVVAGGGGGGGGEETGANSNVDSGTRQRMDQPATGGSGFMSMEGKVERTMGNIVGCKGMQEEGADRVARAEALQRNEARGGGMAE